MGRAKTCDKKCLTVAHQSYMMRCSLTHSKIVDVKSGQILVNKIRIFIIETFC